MARLGFLVVALAALGAAHSPPTFPGTNNVNQPPQAHHQAQAQAGHQQQQVPPAHPNSPPTQQFGGEAVKDSEHIKEHLEGKVDPTANMTPEQMQFHYFNMHDLDKNGRLDGVELIKAITHFHQENPNPNRPDAHQPPPLPTELELEQMIDSILKEDDFNSDGFIDYGEFIRAQKQREEAARAHAAQQPPRQ
uniref:EF-hand domain-containing protein n=1 Tax=Panagrellus redivivus TaxID=6233 RepID=A0A7E5A169_PANRE